MVPSSVFPPPPHGLGPQVVAPIPFYLQAILSCWVYKREKVNSFFWFSTPPFISQRFYAFLFSPKVNTGNSQARLLTWTATALTARHSREQNGTSVSGQDGNNGNEIKKSKRAPPGNPVLAAFLRSSVVFARSLQHFWLPASHLLGTCYLLGDLRSTRTPSKYLRATYSHTYMCYVSTVSTSCLLPVYFDNTTSVEHIPYLPYMSMMPCIPYLSYLSYIPYIPYIWNVITTPTIHTIASIQ